MTNEQMEIVPRILRDMNDGVLVLDMRGSILYMNEQGRALMGQSEDLAGMKYAALMAQDNEGKNDAFHQFVLDAVYDKENTHCGEAAYQLPNQTQKQFRLTTSFLRGPEEDGGKPIGVVVVFSDITEVTRLHQQRRESSAIFAIMMICVCGYLFLWSLLRHLNAEPPGWVMSIVIEAISVLMFFVIIKTTSFSIRDIGLLIPNARETFVPDILITVAGTIAMVLGKVVLLRVAPGFFPEGAPFWDWSVGTVADVFYPLTAILQEFLARGVMQENLRRIFTGKHAAALSIIVSSLVFGVLHIAYGLPFMLAASLLLGLLGVLYNKQRNIWGLAIIHYVLGEVATFLRYII